MTPHPEYPSRGCIIIIVFATWDQLRQWGPPGLREFLERHPSPGRRRGGARILPFDRTFMSLTWEQFRSRETDP
jgi:hypothetical protein